MAYTSYEGEVPTIINTGSGSNGGGIFGGEGGWWAGIIGLIAVAAIFGDGGIFGNNGNRGNAAVQGALTREQACIDNNFQNLMRETAGISDAVNLGFANLNSTICNQQYDTARMIDALNVSNLQSFNAMNISNLQSANALQSQLASCCCGVERAIDGVNYNMATNTCAITNTINNSTRDIIDSQREGTQAILNYLCNEKISALQTENAVLTGQISQAAQTNAIINALRPFPAASYIVPNPFTGAFGYGNNCGCGCSSI